MRKVLALSLLVVVAPCAAVQAQNAVEEYPETIAVLNLIHREQIEAARTYLAFARQAHTEERFNIESFFVALAASELLRAETFTEMLEEMQVAVQQVEENEVRVSNTRFNLQLMTTIEAAKTNKRYPLLIERIKDEGHAVAIANLTHAWEVEKQHVELAEEVLSSLKAFFGIAAKISDEFYICQTCGSTLAEVPELTCPICQGPTSDYEKASAKWQFYSYIENTYTLTDEEKAYAKRMFDYVYEQVYEEHEVQPDPALYSTELYRKWGLGPLREFSLEERAYLMRLSETAEMWSQYTSIDLENLDAAEREFLKEMHEKYGEGPVDLKQRRLEENGSLSEQAEVILDQVKVVSGRKLFEDKDLIFLRSRITTAVKQQ